MNRTIVEMARTLLNDAGLPKTYWGYAILHAAHILNRVPTRTLVDRTPYEAFTGNKPSVSHLRTFGCKAHVHVPDEKRRKLDPKSLDCVYLGYADHRKAHRCLYVPTGRIIESRDVVFEEDNDAPAERVVIDLDDSLDVPSTPTPPPSETISKPPSTPPLSHPTPEKLIQTTRDTLSDVLTDVQSEKPPVEAVPPPPPAPTSQGPTTHPHTRRTQGSAHPHPASTPPDPRRSTRTRRAPDRDDHPKFALNSRDKASVKAMEDLRADEESRDDEDDEDEAFQDAADASFVENQIALAATLDEPPQTYAQAMARPDALEWKLACIAELEAFVKAKLYDEVERPKDRTLVACRWVFTIKRGPDGEIIKHKARLVAKGFTQVEGVDYTETFAPVSKFTSIRALLALAAQEDLEIHQMDVKSAFLNGDLSEEIYMKLPPGYDAQDGMVWKLKKSLYGLKQASRQWYKRLRQEFADLGFTRSQYDHAIFYKNEGGVIIICAVYVDDMLIVCKDIVIVRRLKDSFKVRFEMTDLGEARWILNMEIIRDRPRRILELSQRQFVTTILNRFGLADGRPVSTPLDPNTKLVKLSAPDPEVDVKIYQSMLGSLMYAMIGTRPDLAYSVGVLSKHSATPGLDHLLAITRVYRYLKNTMNIRLTYRGTPPGARDGISSNLIGYVDADWASDPNDRRSITGYVFTLAGTAISWSSKRQHSVALSSTEAEYMAATHATKEAIWLHGLLVELGRISAGYSIPLLIDNQSAIALIKNPEHHERTKHIAIRYHFIRDIYEAGTIELEYVPTGDQVADVLTKALGREKHYRFLDGMGQF